MKGAAGASGREPSHREAQGGWATLLWEVRVQSWEDGQGGVFITEIQRQWEAFVWAETWGWSRVREKDGEMKKLSTQ